MNTQLILSGTLIEIGVLVSAPARPAAARLSARAERLRLPLMDKGKLSSAHQAAQE